MKIKKIFFILILLVLSIYSYSKITNSFSDPITQKEVPSNNCQTKNDCETPFEFLIQSNCPFESACIEGHCQVVCPLPSNDPGEQAWRAACKSDNDCDCSMRAEKTIKCLCLDDKCVSIKTN